MAAPALGVALEAALCPWGPVRSPVRIWRSRSGLLYATCSGMNTCKCRPDLSQGLQ